MRIRPLGPFDPSDVSTHSVVDVSGSDGLVINDEKRNYNCSFDQVLEPTSSQQDVYETISGCINNVLKGFNSTIFAYGQTGSGKTHTMYGPPVTDIQRYHNPNFTGLIPRCLADIFHIISSPSDSLEFLNNMSLNSITVYCSFIQIYNENIYDMLR